MGRPRKPKFDDETPEDIRDMTFDEPEPAPVVDIKDARDAKKPYNCPFCRAIATPDPKGLHKCMCRRELLGS